MYILTTKLFEADQKPFKIERIRVKHDRPGIESLQVVSDDGGARIGGVALLAVIQAQKASRSQGASTTIQFFTEISNLAEQSAGIRNQQWLGTTGENTRFLGSFKVPQEPEDPRIVGVKWISGLGQVIVLYDDCRFDILSSDTASTILKQIGVNRSRTSGTTISEGLRNELDALWEARLRSPAIDTFRSITGRPIGLHPKMGSSPADSSSHVGITANTLRMGEARKVIDFEVLNVSLGLDEEKDEGKVLCTIALIVFFENSIEFYDITAC